MKEVDPEKFLRLSVKEHDTIDIKVVSVEIGKDGVEYVYEIYNTDINLAPEIVRALDGKEIDTVQLHFSLQGKNILAYIHPVRLIKTLSNYLFTDQNVLNYRIDYGE